MLAQKTRLKAEICPDKMEHFTCTFGTLSPDIYTGMQTANADNMYLYCTVHFRHAQFCTGMRGNGITRVRLRGADCSTTCTRARLELQGVGVEKVISCNHNCCINVYNGYLTNWGMIN